jgi:hypothetical protein
VTQHCWPIDPYDHSAWIATDRNLLAHFDENGRLQGGYTLPDRALAMGYRTRPNGVDRER